MKQAVLSKDHIMEVLGTIEDPEIPVITIVELGIVRDVEIAEDGGVTVVITPTYSGCPAMYAITASIEKSLKAEGLQQVKVKTVFNPAWTTDWITDEARQKLKEYGIAPPGYVIDDDLFDFKPREIACPFCDSADTRRESEFGSTPCKSQYFCNSCRQPFEYFKCH